MTNKNQKKEELEFTKIHREIDPRGETGEPGINGADGEMGLSGEEEKKEIGANMKGYEPTSEERAAEFDFVIEDNVPITPIERKQTKETLAQKLAKNLAKLEVNQSFFIPNSLISDKSISSYRTEAQKLLREQFQNNDLSFVVRKIQDNEGKIIGSRIWRTV